MRYNVNKGNEVSGTCQVDGGALEGGGGRPARWRVGRALFVGNKEHKSEVITTTISNHKLNISNYG